jgi:hypothetical protein
MEIILSGDVAPVRTSSPKCIGRLRLSLNELPPSGAYGPMPRRGLSPQAPAFVRESPGVSDIEDTGSTRPGAALDPPAQRTPSQRTQPRRTRAERIVIWTLVAVFGAMVVGLVALVLWSLGRESPPPAVADYEEYRPAWESAMAKAGVEATFPVVPVDVHDLQVSGYRSLSATFTADEITALATMYRYSYETPEGTVSLLRPEIGFPSSGRVSVSARLVYQGSGYDLRGSIDAAIENGQLELDPTSAELQAAGFTVEGERREQAVRAVEEYARELLTAAPRLTILEAGIVEGAVHVEGAAPQRILNPAGDG